MVPTKLDTEADSDYSSSSDSLFMSSSSSSSSKCSNNDDIEGKGGRQLMKRRVKKSRSIKLGLKPIRRQEQGEVQSDNLSVQISSNAAASGMSPNYMRTTTASNAKKGNSQKSALILTRRSSFKRSKSLIRSSSTKFRRPLMRISSGGNGLKKKKLKNSRSIKLANRSSSFLADYLEAMNCSHPSSHDSEATSSSNDENRKESSNSKLNLASSGYHSTTTSTLRPPRFLKKTASLRTKRTSMKKCSQIQDHSSIQKATCSSAIKESKHPKHLELPSGGSESEGSLVMKACPYSYCSLHGHHHSDAPPRKRFVSIRKKSESGSFRRVKRSSDINRQTQTSQLASGGDSAVLKAAHEKIPVSSCIGRTAEPRAESNREDTVGGADEHTSKLTSVNETQIVHEVAVEFTSASLTLDVCKGDSQVNVVEANASVSINDEQQNEARSLCLNRVVELGAIDNVVSSASISKPSEEEMTASEEKNRDAVRDNQFLSADSDHDYTIDVGLQKEKQKHMPLWNLIYQHMASGIAAVDGIQKPVNKEAEEEEVQFEKISPGMNRSYGSFQDFSSTDQSNDDEKGSQMTQMYQCGAIKIVKEAFDRIFSEIPDQSSDDHSVTSDSASYKDLAEKDQGEDAQLSTSTSSDFVGDNAVQEPEKVRLKAGSVIERENAQSWMEKKSNQQTPKSWSNLKKILIFKRFIKALEKVRNLNPRKPQYLHVEADPGAEEVLLRHQNIERKNSEEWMLDYALQQVISTLAPAQKRKVALLVEAFERVIPITETGASPKSSTSASHQTAPVKICTEASDCKGSSESKETIFGITLRSTSNLQTSFKENQDQASDFCTVEEHIPGSCSELKETSCQNARSTSSSETTSADFKNKLVAFKHDKGETKSILKDHQPDDVNFFLIEDKESKSCNKLLPEPADIQQTSRDEILINGEVLQLEASSVFASEGHERDCRLNGQNSDTNNGSFEELDEPKVQPTKYYEGCIANTKVAASSSVSAPVEESSEIAGEENKTENEFLQGSTLLDESQSVCITDVAHRKQQNMKFWRLIYKHMASGKTALLEGADNEEQADDGNMLIGMKNAHSQPGVSLTKQDKNMENDVTGSEMIELKHIEAIKLVEEAIDQIPLPEFQDDLLDDQSFASSSISDQEEENIKEHNEGEETSISSSVEHMNESFGKSNGKNVEERTTPYQQEPQLNSNKIRAQEKAKEIPTAGNKQKPAMQKKWSHLKKVILLKRFIKALEKVKKINPQEPRFLPSDTAREAEKIHLRHQGADDMRNGDDWMLDHALQQVVAKLTPARKRKVALLVEAFEAVTPVGTIWLDK